MHAGLLSSALASLFAVAFLPAVASAVVPISANLNIRAEVTIHPDPMVVDESTDAWGTPLSPLHVDASESVGSESASGFADASWSSPFAGSVLFDTQAHLDNHPNGPSATVDVAGTGWTYTFTTPVPLDLILNHDVTNALTIAGDIAAQGGGGFSYVLDGESINLAGLGSLTRPVGIGTHTVQLKIALGYISGTGNAMTVTHDAQFDWSLTPVPEPASLCLLGMAGGAALRRRRASSLITRR